jgi:hypothetical protein
LPQTKHALHELTPPAPEAATWRKLLAVADRMTANAQEQIRAARATDAPVFVRTVKTAQQLGTEIDALGAGFGFRADSACARVFG